ncbi:metallophosphoesterase family protein [Paenibacillus sp. IHBB 10380]|uniref:metallophosphoesterase family protein n=1 Tax=Paenibacillus sp. IHBB 10380 TaxID=1566358 RepID=UPI0005CFBCAD|nr:DNA repair exonuclease [Paenibacillus sp. IHBB 10380]AJS59405.1 metallophosphoesterase [Paenibacillus sp. IHBB 10380]
MIPFRFIHTADLHLDSLFAGMKGLSDSLRHHLRESTFGALIQLVEVAIAEQVDFLVISGDVYDAANRSLRAQLSLQAAFDQLGYHGIHVYLIHGNHDPLDGLRLHGKPNDHVHVFGSEVEHFIAKRRSDQQEVAVVSGISYPTSKVTENTALRFIRDKESSLFHIAIHHANLDGDLEHETYSPCTRHDLSALGYDYWALGHIHQRAIIQETPHIVYPGNIQGRSIKEIGAKGCYVVEVNEDATLHMAFHELDRVRWFREEISIDGIENEDAWRIKVEERMELIRTLRPQHMSIVRFTITGRGQVHRALEHGYLADELEEELRRKEIMRAEHQQFGGLVWIEGFSLQSGIEIDYDVILHEDSFLGEMVRLVERSVQNDSVQDILRVALTPLMGNREIRKILNDSSEQERLDWLHRAGEMGAVLLLDKASDGGSKS